MQRINDLFSAWHGARDGRITVFPAASLTETSSPELLQAVRDFAETHDLGYTIHRNQSRAGAGRPRPAASPWPAMVRGSAVTRPARSAVAG